MNDTKILSAIKALHERFIEEPTREKIYHLDEFINGGKVTGPGCMHDVSGPTWEKLQRYTEAFDAVMRANFSPKSITHLNEVAKETLS